jgi:hypothetical protein
LLSVTVGLQKQNFRLQKIYLRNNILGLQKRNQANYKDKVHPKLFGAWQEWQVYLKFSIPLQNYLNYCGKLLPFSALSKLCCTCCKFET